VRIPGFNARALGRGWGDDIQARLQNGIGKHRFKTAGFWVSERANKKLGEAPTKLRSLTSFCGLVMFFEVKNVLDRTYVASANNITDSINAATGLQNPGSVLTLTGTGSIYAGAPRSFIGGLKLAFR
jgi:outer membrane receptor protein involved in Fe transport